MNCKISYTAKTFLLRLNVVTTLLRVFLHLLKIKKYFLKKLLIALFYYLRLKSVSQRKVYKVILHHFWEYKYNLEIINYQEKK